MASYINHTWPSEKQYLIIKQATFIFYNDMCQFKLRSI
ncbi:hypothetical protein KSS87_016247 [Heliosperma pusillum]|nr:hypothetical protein KSS87_016247 [Heliosperma pusillum]